MKVGEFLAAYHPHVDGGYWENEITTGRILYKESPVNQELEVWAGQRLVHLLKGTVEPPICGDIKIIFEDNDVIVVDKPAPIAMHPCGRFNRNSLSYILNSVYQGEKIRMTHRLDANTTGVVVFARKRHAAQLIQNQFLDGAVEKTYLAKVHGHPDKDVFVCKESIAAEPGQGGIRVVDPNGLSADTSFKVVNRSNDGTTLIQCKPKTGRTNQIRIHLWSLGFPIVNDPSYLVNGQTGNNQTLKVEDPGMCLHAWKLEIDHPTTAQRLAFESARPNWAND